MSEIGCWREESDRRVQRLALAIRLMPWIQLLLAHIAALLKPKRFRPIIACSFMSARGVMRCFVLIEAIVACFVRMAQ